jgi:hypothetical protein
MTRSAHGRRSAEQQHARIAEHATAVAQMLGMMADMQALRSEVERLQTMPAAELARPMPAPLHRPERMLPVLEQCGTRSAPSGPVLPPPPGRPRPAAAQPAGTR